MRSLVAKLLACGLLSLAANSPAAVPEAEIRMACEKPYRKVGETCYDLNPRFNFALTGNKLPDGAMFAEKPVPEFEFLHGRILSVTDEGILIRSFAEEDTFFEGKYDVIFVKNFPFRVVDDQRVAVYAKESGTLQYKNALGVTKTVECYDFGKTPADAEVAELKAAAKKKSETYFTAVEQRRAAETSAAAQKKAENNKRLLSYYKEKAEKGDAFAQYRLGEIYYRGEMAARDLPLATRWLSAASTNSQPEAAKLLQKISDETQGTGSRSGTLPPATPKDPNH